ncbi:hypothetical protein GCM10023080_055440 [Streptomyces pseudoechinosporeus]
MQPLHIPQQLAGFLLEFGICDICVFGHDGSLPFRSPQGLPPWLCCADPWAVHWPIRTSKELTCGAVGINSPAEQQVRDRPADPVVAGKERAAIVTATVLCVLGAASAQRGGRSCA